MWYWQSVPLSEEKSIASLRFNFRGVGNSGGSYDEGRGEQDDVIAALDYLSTLKEIDSRKIGLAGYSFGGMVADAVAMKDNRVKQLALISPALRERRLGATKRIFSAKTYSDRG